MFNLVKQLKKKLFYNVFLFLLFISSFCSSAYGAANNSITGKVTDASTGKPVKNVNIYLAYTMIGTTSDEEGYFEIKNIEPGTYIVIFSHVSYNRNSASIQIVEGKTNKLSIKLTPKIYELNTVAVVSDDLDEWRDNLEIFKERLIGTSTFAEQVNLINPEIIDFKENDAGNLVAYTDKPLEFINNALGYKITYYLEYFEANSVGTKFSGIPKFEELVPEDESQKEKWEENRKSAYRGSLRQFLTLISEKYDSTQYYKNKIDSLNLQGNVNTDEIDKLTDKMKYFESNDFLEEKGFVILVKPELSNKYIINIIFDFKMNEHLAPGRFANELYITSLKKMVIKYNLERPDRNYISTEEPDFPTSSIDMLADSVLIDKHGRYFEKFMIRANGYWAFERLAEILPYEYEPDE